VAGQQPAAPALARYQQEIDQARAAAAGR
jgi:hypothetical protein